MRWVSALTAVLWVAYPLAVYFALRAGSPRIAAAVLAAAFVPSTYLRLKAAPPGAVRALAWLPAVFLGTLGLAALLNSQGLLLFVPVAVSSVFLVVFASSLVSGPPMVERFALLVDADLSESEQGWCRLWTQIWSAFFLLNGAVTAFLSSLSSLELWTVYTGLVSYIVMGTLFGVEYTVRKYRFGRLGRGRLDRALAYLFTLTGRRA